VELLRGATVRRVLSQVVPALSPFGGDSDDVAGAIRLVDDAGSAEACIARTMSRAARFRSGWFTNFPVESRLAFEMSLQEDDERRALHGELAALEAAWREAEQIATIADNLFLPTDVLERLIGLRQGLQRRPGFAIG